MTNLRIYNPDDVGPDGYPHAWHHDHWHDNVRYLPIKDTIRAQAGHRCERCLHPYKAGDPRISAAGQWSPCDIECGHTGLRVVEEEKGFEPRIYACPPWQDVIGLRSGGLSPVARIEAQWRILTVHHLNGVKYDCRWWNLAALCQRCHLSIQGRVVMDRVYPFEHTEWFKPHAAGWYAADYLGEDLTREETYLRLEELLSLERVA